MAQKQDPKELFGMTPVRRLFLMAAIPGAVGMLVSSIYGTIDGILVGTYVGETQFAAVNLAFPYIFILFSFGDLIGVGSAVPISIALGEGRDDDANNLFSVSCLLNIASGAVLGLLLWLLAPLIFSLQGATGELASSATTYLRVYALFAPITTIGYAFDNYLRISGRIHRSLGANTFLAISGAILEFILLGPMHMGVGAAAFAYSMAIVGAVVISAWPFLRGRLQLRFVRPRLRMADLVEIFRCGVSTFLENVAGRITAIVLNTVLLGMGGERAVSLYGVTMFADEIITPIMYGTLDALQPAVGYNWGAREFKRVKGLEMWCFGTVAVASALFAAVLFAVPERIVTLFLPTADAALIAEACVVLRLFAAASLVRWFPYGSQSFLINVGDAIGAATLSVAAALAVPLPLIWLLRPMGLMGMWSIPLVTAILTGVLAAFLLLRLRRNVRRQMALDEG